MSPIVANAPPKPTPAEEIADALDRIPVLQGLNFDERLWLALHAEEFVGQPGEVMFEENTPAEWMFLLLKGEVHVQRRGGSMALFIGRAGQMTGLLPFSRMKTFGGQGVAVTQVWGLLIHKSQFPEMLEAIPSMTQRVVSTLLDRVREVTRIEQQAEKLAALGKLAGNLAHELNNPASAAQRAASSLVSELRANRANRFKLAGQHSGNDCQFALIPGKEWTLGSGYTPVLRNRCYGKERAIEQSIAQKYGHCRLVSSSHGGTAIGSGRYPAEPPVAGSGSLGVPAAECRNPG